MKKSQGPNEAPLSGHGTLTDLLFSEVQRDDIPRIRNYNTNLAGLTITIRVKFTVVVDQIAFVVNS